MKLWNFEKLNQVESSNDVMEIWRGGSSEMLEWGGVEESKKNQVKGQTM